MLWPRDIYWSVMAVSGADVAAQLPAVVFGAYGRAALIVVPVSVLAIAAVALSPRRRRMALWLMLGTLAGATAVFMILCAMALTWQVD
jgi:type VI protein secretion system component VasF